MKKYILFDHDGVLVDTEYWYFMSNKRALSELGIVLDKELYLKNMAKDISCWSLARRSAIDESTIAEKRAKRNRYYQEYLKNENIEIDGVEEILCKLSKKHKMAIITTSKRKDFEQIHKERRITHYMDFVLTEEDYDNAKPHPDPYFKGLEIFGAKKEETIIVEDSGQGLKAAAAAAGVDCAIVHNEFTKTHDFSTAKHRIKHLNDLIVLLGPDNVMNWMKML
jgi:HAD superfamily hydrolase (TIGR01509 family)